MDLPSDKFSQLAKASDYIITERDSNGRTISVQIPGLRPDDLTRRGGVAVWRILIWFIRAEYTAFKMKDEETGKTFIDYDQVALDRMVFVRSLEMAVDNGLYRVLEEVPPRNLTMKVSLESIGNTSWTMFDVLRDNTSSRTLVTCKRRMVVVDKQTRRSSAVPDWWKQKHVPLVVENQRNSFQVLEVPDRNVYKHAIRVAWDDTGMLKHVNFPSFVVFCFETAMSAVQDNFYVGFYNDICDYNVKTVRLLYMGEVLAGETLTVLTWQDQQNPMTIHFSIEKEEGKIVVQSSMEFFIRSSL